MTKLSDELIYCDYCEQMVDPEEPPPCEYERDVGGSFFCPFDVDDFQELNFDG